MLWFLEFCGKHGCIIMVAPEMFAHAIAVTNIAHISYFRYNGDMTCVACTSRARTAPSLASHTLNTISEVPIIYYSDTLWWSSFYY